MHKILERIASYDHYEVVMDTRASVLYLVAEGRGAHGGGIAITPMLNRDGSPRTHIIGNPEPIIRKVYDGDYYEIMEDIITGVLYLVAEGRGAHGGGVAITPMLHRNGSPRTHIADDDR
ncbi:hypothetical protein IKG31_02420 [Candidatus Saccharibacteria bacterium]|nr:hypothetical protein [Candidatus Saccharibacteria bacterium]